jgi:hypothetical protein
MSVEALKMWLTANMSGKVALLIMMEVKNTMLSFYLLSVSAVFFKFIQK